jgi:hypothetical protein
MRVKSLLALVVVATALAVGASQALAVTTWTVDQTTGTNNCAGNICKTISKAVLKAANGDTIVVHPGLYSENVTVNKKLTIKASKKAPDLLTCNDNRTDPDPTKFAVLDGGGGGTGFDITVSGVTIDSFIIQNFDTGIRTDPGFLSYTLKNNLLQDNLTAGMDLNSNGTTSVTGNCLRDTPFGIVNMTGQLKSATLSQNHFWTNGQDVNVGTFGPTTTVKITGNQSDSSGFFLQAENSTTLTVSGNIIKNSSDATAPPSGAIVLGGGVVGFTVSGNIIQNGVANGIVVVDGGPGPNSTGKISSNIVQGMGGDGLFVMDSGSTSLIKTTVSSNIFGNNGDDGIHVEKQTVAVSTLNKNTFTGNIATGNPVHDCHDGNSKDVWTGNTNIGHRVNKTGLCFPGDVVTGPQNHAPF